ncbi:uncharacterized protein LOC103314627 [Tribolium castaneum]|uniref:Odorant receptor n=1 Tax=Tribolium castaneum TaxID=7070 RepID=D6WN42_TRICA|nr:PREDICTED: uncharacterized protein LOC103314627 [Tribolium castaneum]EFA04733.1 odorant receptor 146 [Tribolium castaneum]|eukprot:XP_008199312.2 PREDICTED: uncharacterized protein LOC103314627 [Tribolium castaneum]
MKYIREVENIKAGIFSSCGIVAEEQRVEMSEKNQQDYFKIPDKCYNWSGVRVSSNALTKFVSLYILYPLMLILYFMIIYNIRFKKNISDITEVFISISTFTIITFRKTLLIRNGSIYEDILKKQSHYWKYYMFGKPTEMKLRKSMEFCVMVIKFLIASTTGSIIFHSIISPIIEGKIVLPQPCWVPNNDPVANDIIFALENIFYMEGTNYLVVFDGLYLLMTANLKTQMILLRKAVASINFREDEKTTWAKLKEYCEYHKFLLRIHGKINKIYSAFFLMTYVFTIMGTCTPLFVIFYEEADMVLLGKSVFIALILNTLLVMTFIPAGELEIEAEKLSFEIYSINWYETKNLKIRKFVLFWIMQTQIPVQMSGGGMLIVNRPLVLQVQRIAYSLTSFLAGLS